MANGVANVGINGVSNNGAGNDDVKMAASNEAKIEDGENQRRGEKSMGGENRRQIMAAALCAPAYRAQIAP
jgi:hypothetical protein